MKKALILGATGLIGSHVVGGLLDHPSYEEIRVVTRSRIPVDHPKLHQTVIDFDDLSDYEDCFDVDELFICLGTTMKQAGSREAFYQVDFKYVVEAAKLAKKCHVPTVLVVSAMGADSDSMFFYSRVKGNMENELRNLGLHCLKIFQPSLLLGERSELRLGEKIGEYAYRIFGLAMIGKWKKLKPIHAETVANAMIKEAQQGGSVIITYTSEEIAVMGK